MVAENLISAVSCAPDDALVTMAHAMLTEVVSRQHAARQENADGEKTPTNTGSPQCQHSFFSSTEFGFVECKYCGVTYPIEAQRAGA
jgi:hypothetical protein